MFSQIMKSDYKHSTSLVNNDHECMNHLVRCLHITLVKPIEDLGGRTCQVP